jgi:DNA-binding SARP family transcriptional activator
MEFRILGPIMVYEGGTEIPLGKSKERVALAALLLHANERLSRERLVDLVWGEAPPRTVNAAMHNCVSKLRRALGADRLLGDGGAYRLVVAEGELDRDRFESLVADGRAAFADGVPERAASLLAEALALWRGEPLEDVRYEPFAQTEIRRLEELRLSALEARVEAELACGRHAALVAELGALVRVNPWRERLHAQLMLSLYRCGRQADALAAYQSARAALDEVLGLEPARELQELERRILRHDPVLELAETGPAGRPADSARAADRARAGACRAARAARGAGRFALAHARRSGRGRQNTARARAGGPLASTGRVRRPEPALSRRPGVADDRARTRRA